MIFGKDPFDFIRAILSWGAIMVGGACLLIYCASIGHPPRDVELGQGIAFYFISVGLLLLYALYWLAVTSVGTVLMRWPMVWLQRFVASVPENAPAYVRSDLATMWQSWLIILAGLSVLYGLLIVRGDVRSLWMVLIVAAAQGVVSGVLLMLRRRAAFDRTGVVLRKDEVSTERAAGQAERRYGMYAMLGVWIFFPLLGLPRNVHFVDAAFRFAQLRKHHATVHLKAPWPAILSDSGLKTESSFLGSDHTKVCCVNVLLNNIGRW